ncbi:MAG: protein kinase [Polyangiaceae bacterium]
MSEAPPPDLTGRVVLDRYRVERMIGQGGMGTVWAGRHVSLGHLVAIKFIHEKLSSSPDAVRRFDIEAKAAARIKTRHAAQVYDHGVTEDGRPFIAMEYLEGESLEQRLRQRGALGIDEVKRIVAQAALALEAAHTAHVVHRDLKPDNIFLAKDPEEPTWGYVVKLVDFGIAKIVQDDASVGAPATQAGTVLGTPHYMSPEALTASAPVSTASDIWSLGACAFAALTGRPPFEGDAIGDVVLKVCASPLPVPSRVHPGLPHAFDAWFARCCARDPAKRFASVREQAEALERLEVWADALKATEAFELKRAEVDLDKEIARATGGGSRGLAVGLGIAALGILGVGLYAAKVAREANQAVQQTAESAAAVVDRDNEKKLREADEAFWGAKDAGPDATAPKPKTPRRKP